MVMMIAPFVFNNLLQIIKATTRQQHDSQETPADHPKIKTFGKFA